MRNKNYLWLPTIIIIIHYQLIFSFFGLSQIFIKLLFFSCPLRKQHTDTRWRWLNILQV